MANRRHNYCRSSPIFPGHTKLGHYRRINIVLDHEEWAEFREYLDRDRLPMQVLISRLIRQWMTECREFYRKAQDEEIENAAVGGEQ
jgi:hypothetical protein